MATTDTGTEAAAAPVIAAEPGTPSAGGPDREFTIKARSQRQQVIRHFLHNKVGMTGLIVFAILLLFAFLGPLANPKDYSTLNRFAQSLPPGTRGYLLGSDAIGRDLLSGIMIGIQRSLLIVLLFVAVALPLGLVIGALAGYFGKWVDSVLMRFVDLVLTVPLLVVLIVVASNFPSLRTATGVGLLIGLFGWMDLARIVRSQFLSLREKEYVEAARSLGAGSGRILFRELLPNLVGPILVYSTLIIPTNILFEAALSFLGVGVRIPRASWGGMLSDAVQYYTNDPMYMIVPGVAIFITVMAFNLFGDGLRDALDPRSNR